MCEEITFVLAERHTRLLLVGDCSVFTRLSEVAVEAVACSVDCIARSVLTGWVTIDDLVLTEVASVIFITLTYSVITVIAIEAIEITACMLAFITKEVFHTDTGSSSIVRIDLLMNGHFTFGVDVYGAVKVIARGLFAEIASPPSVA